ncbi:MAG: glycosyltransferase family 2 protein [Janthinobacterium lividum]
MDTPLVSILINNYNYGRFLDDAVKSTLAQTYANVEVIVVDDGSTDDSLAVLEKYKDRITILSKANGGQASAFNMGVAHSKGEMICFLDADDAFAADKVAQLVKAQQEFPDTEYWFDKVVLCNESLAPFDPKARSGQTYYSDYRAQIRTGSLGRHLVMAIPATSGLSFRASLLKKIFPIPESESCSMCENYMKYVSVGVSKGVFMDTSLTLQRIHGKNLFTTNTVDPSMTARISIMTGYWLNRNFPDLGKFSDTQIALATSQFGRMPPLERKYHQLIQAHYQSRGFLPSLKIRMRSLYYVLRQTMDGNRKRLQ